MNFQQLLGRRLWLGVLIFPATLAGVVVLFLLGGVIYDWLYPPYPTWEQRYAAEPPEYRARVEGCARAIFAGDQGIRDDWQTVPECAALPQLERFDGITVANKMFAEHVMRALSTSGH